MQSIGTKRLVLMLCVAIVVGRDEFESEIMRMSQGLGVRFNGFLGVVVIIVVGE